MGWRFGVKGKNCVGLPVIWVSMSSSSSSEIKEVGGVIEYWGAEVPNNDICSCCATNSWVMALYVSGTLFDSCGIGDEPGESISLSSLDRKMGCVSISWSSLKLN